MGAIVIHNDSPYRVIFGLAYANPNSVSADIHRVVVREPIRSGINETRTQHATATPCR